MNEPIARVVLPRWVRVLAFLGWRPAVIEVRSAKFMDWYLREHGEEIAAEATVAPVTRARGRRARRRAK
jgi:hypothetical protein